MQQDVTFVEKSFQKIKIIVRDHCHYTSEYRIATHSIYDLRCPTKSLYFFTMFQIMIIILLLKN